MSKDNEWIDCDFIGTIKKYDNEPKNEPVENFDDYDVRHEYGSRVRNVKSRLDRMEM